MIDISRMVSLFKAPDYLGGHASFSWIEIAAHAVLRKQGSRVISGALRKDLQLKRIIVIFVAAVIMCPDLLCYAQVANDKGVERRVEGLLSKLTLEQKIDLIGGQDSFYIRAVPQIGLPRLKMSDASAGVRTWGPSTAYPAPIALAATWNTSLAEQAGVALGIDSRARGVAFLLAPGVNIARAPMAGRSFEYLGEDPYLASRVAVSYIKGVQSQGVCATVKHFMMNNQEFDRNRVSSNADERTMREIYMPAFEAAVKDADVCAIMNSYNLISGIHATQNGWMDNQVAKTEWGFKGIIMSDWMSVYDGVAAANAGLDLEMPFARYMTRATLLPAIRSGVVSEATIDDKARRILRVAVRFGFMDHPQTLDLPLYSIEHDQLALHVEQEGIVLLKNDRNVLPLDSNKTCTIAVIGPNAFPSVTGGGGSSLVTPFKADSILTGLYDYLSVHGPNSPGCNAKVLYDSGMPNHAEIFDHKTFDHGMQQSIFNKGDWSGIPTASTIDFMSDEVHTTVQKGISARWEGTFTAPQSGQYYIAVASKSGDGYSVLVNGKKVSWELSNQADSVRYFPANLLAGQMASVQINLVPTGTDLAVGVAMRSERDLFSEHALQIAKTADAVVCAVGYNREIEREGMDRSFTLPWPQNKLIREIASTNKNTIVTINSGGNVDMNSWIDNIPALLQLWYPGQAGGAALASILFGEVSPTGKLPVTFEKQWADNPVYSSYYLSATGENSIRSVKYSEGVFVGYRAFAGSNIHPQFPFGYGLSYSSFALSNLQLDRSTMFSQDQLGISVDIENIGKRRSAEVVQVYVGDPSAKVHRPVKELKSFAKVWLEPGETRTVKFTLDPRAFSYWDEKQEKWIIDPGNFEIYVGNSSEDTPLHSTFTVQ